MNKDETAIRQLLERFMAGETSPQENDQIADWFKSHPMVSDDLKDYQAMFGYLDAGMPWDFAATSEEVPFAANKKVDNNMPTPKTKKRALRPWWISLSAAAAIAVAFLVLTPHSSEIPTKQRVVAISRNDSIMDSVANSKAEKEIRPSSPHKHIYHKYQFEIAPPAKHLAIATRQESELPDTLVESSRSLPSQDLQLAENIVQHYTPEQIEKLTDQALERMLVRQEELMTDLFGKDPSTDRLTSQDVEME